jgi:hypothetical protein
VAKGKRTVDDNGTIRIGGKYAGRMPGYGAGVPAAREMKGKPSFPAGAGVSAGAVAAAIQPQLDAHMGAVAAQEAQAEDRQYVAAVWQGDEREIRDRLERIRAERRERETERKPLTLRERLRAWSRRKTVAVAAALAAGGLALTGCGAYAPPEADNVAVCVDQKDPSTAEDDVRVDDEQCGDLDGTQRTYSGGGSSAFLWYYLGTLNRTSYPAVGSKVSGGSFTVPAATAVTMSGLDRAGAKLAPGETVSSKVNSPNGKAIGGKTGGGYGKGSVSVGGLGGGGAKGIGG